MEVYTDAVEEQLTVFINTKLRYLIISLETGLARGKL